MVFSLYIQPQSSEPTGKPPNVIPMSEKEIEEIKKGMIEHAEKTMPVFEANHRYLRENYNNLLKQYPDQYVAVHERRVVASAHSIQEILIVVDRLGIDRHFTMFEFMDTNPKPMIL